MYFKIFPSRETSPVTNTVCSVQCKTQNRWFTPQYALNVFLLFSSRFGTTTSCDGCRQSLTALNSLEFHRTRSGDQTLCSTTSETVTIITSSLPLTCSLFAVIIRYLYKERLDTRKTTALVIFLMSDLLWIMLRAEVSWYYSASNPLKERSR